MNQHHNQRMHHCDCQKSGVNKEGQCQVLKDSTHMVIDPEHRKRTYLNILDTFGNTPLVKLNKIPQAEGIQCEMYAKCEFMNPGGSSKDRIAYRMVFDAELSGRITPGVSILVEPTSGNTGIALALAGAVKGYKVIIVMADKDSDEKQLTMQALGAEVIRVRSDAEKIAAEIVAKTPHAVMLDQFANVSNPLGQYDTTGEELLWDLDHKIDMVVMGAGSGGTISGAGCLIKRTLPHCLIVGVDPYGSIFAPPTKKGPYEVEGIGGDSVPEILDYNTIDKWVKVHDEDSFKMARRLIREEGLLCGGSSGAAMWAAVQMAKTMGPGARVVVLLPDTIRNYMSRFVTDQWMEARDYWPVPSANLSWWKKTITGTMINLWLHIPTIANDKVPAGNVLQQLVNDNVPCAAIVDRSGAVTGVTTLDYIRKQVANTKDHTLQDPIEKFTVPLYYKVDLRHPPTLGYVSRVLDITPYILVVQSDQDGMQDIQRPIGVITSETLMKAVSGPHFHNLAISA